MKHLDIAIVGAGIGGLSAALALQRSGFRVRVYEQAARLTQVGAGLSLSPTAAHALNHLGLHQMLVDEAYAPEDQFIRHYQDGRPLLKANRGRALLEKYGERYYVIHRADLHDALARAVRQHDARAIRLDARCVGLEQRGGRVRLRFAAAGEGAGGEVDAGHVEADVVIGADGQRSVVRESLFGPGAPAFAGYIAWRGLVPIERVRGILLDPPSGIFIGPGHLVNRYPVSRRTQVNFVAFAERTAWTAEGWAIPSTVEELLAEFVGWHPDVLALMAATPPELLFKWGLFDRPELAAWGLGHVTLLGDAAHPVLPFLGHGAVLAIEDAVVLARAFEASHSIPEALHRYEQARKPRATFVLLESRKAVKRFHASNPEHYAVAANHRSADEGLGLFDYNPVTAEV
jgi:salicylate hydroxylase